MKLSERLKKMGDVGPMYRKDVRPLFYEAAGLLDECERALILTKEFLNRYKYESPAVDNALIKLRGQEKTDEAK